MFSKGIFKPLAFINANIAGADSAGLAVNTNIFLGPNLLCNFKAFWNNGAVLPSTTLLNSEKSNLYPKPNKSWYVLAYCSGVNVPFSPSKVVYLIKDLLVASVSSKSNMVIPFIGLLADLEKLTALFKACTCLGDLEKTVTPEAISAAFLKPASSVMSIAVSALLLSFFILNWTPRLSAIISSPLTILVPPFLKVKLVTVLASNMSRSSKDSSLSLNDISPYFPVLTKLIELTPLPL